MIMQKELLYHFNATIKILHLQYILRGIETLRKRIHVKVEQNLS